MIRVLLVIGVVVLIVILCRKPSQKSNFSPHVCDGHCFRNGKGEIMDIYDCCECRATVTNQFEPNFHMCMCGEGYNDYCYRPVTNLLLSQ